MVFEAMTSIMLLLNHFSLMDPNKDVVGCFKILDASKL
jgi:hypothetical protein